MQQKSRLPWIFVAGLAVSAAVVIGAYLAWSRTPQVAPVPVFSPPAEAAAAPQPVAAAPAPPASCDFDPLVAAATEARDGQFALASALALHRSGDPAPFVAVADEAAREARPRDTEVALIAACRVAARSGATSAPLADIQTRLAHLYATQAGRQQDGAARTALLERAEGLLGETVQNYSASLGREASKTRLAQQRLANLRAGTPPEPMTAAAPPPPKPLVVAAENPVATSMGAARQSLAERGPALSDDLREVDRDLQRLYAQARSVSSDPAGMQQRHAQALAQRNACGSNDACLRNWYAQRRKQLFDEF